MTQVLLYVDPGTGCRGFLVYDRLDHRLAAGGCRMQAGLTVETLTTLAARMTLKQRVLGLHVDGAKCGLDLDPRTEGSEGVLARFLDFLRHELATRYSMGCDMGTRFDQLEGIARGVGIDSVKSAVRVAQELSIDEFSRRMSVLDCRVGSRTVGQRRAGHALAHAALTAVRAAGYRSTGLRVGIQGFGTLGRGAAESLSESGALVTAVADRHGCVVDPHGLDVAAMLRTEPSRAVVDMLDHPVRRARTVLCELPLDVLLLAAGEDAITLEQAQALPVPIVAVGANCGLRPEAEQVLHHRGVTVLPDFVGGCGGSASMEALFGPDDTPSPQHVMDRIEIIVTEMVTDVLAAARTRNLPAGQVALDMTAAAAVLPDQRPYGASPYLRSRPTPERCSLMTTVQPAPESSCQHERSHIVDSAFYGHRYSTLGSRRIFCDRCRFQRWLDIEAALALAQAELDIIPADAAAVISKTAQIHLIDLEAVRHEIRRTRHSLVGLLRVFQSACEGDAGEYVHYGATTQDIQDTGQSLEMRDVLDELDNILAGIIARLVELAEAHHSTVALGRTHAQPALPMSFGVKVASWLDEIMRHAERVEAMRPRIQVVQLFGGVGTMAGLGDQALAVLDRFAGRLGLHVPLIGWHVARDRVAEYVTTLATVTGTMGRIAEEVRLLSRPEFAELEEGWYHGKVGSSTMPHKRNPEACEQAVVMARLTGGLLPAALAAMGGDNERDSRALRLEWACVPDVSHYTLVGAENVRTILDGLIVHTDRMRDNVRVVADQVGTEGLMLAMGQRVGKQTAHEVVYELSQAARSAGVSLRELVRQHPAAASLTDDDLDRVFDPARYLGQSERLTLRVVAHARSWLRGRVAAA
jgi:adenylosuccinate lyase